MARGRAGSYDSGVVYLTRHRDIPMDPELDYRESKKAQRISDFADEDAYDISNKSRLKDKELLKNITQTLHRVEFDGVKPDIDISMKTGFRRKMYHQKMPLIEKEYKEERRKDKLKYPWDYTKDNIYRPTTKKYGYTKSKRREPKDEDKKDLDPPPGPYPQYDPMGVYTQRPKRQHKPLPDLHEKNKYDDMNLHQKLVMVKAKVQAMPKWRDARKDVDIACQSLATPLPKSSVAGKEIYTIDDYEEYDNYKKSGLDGPVANKVKQTREELAQFESTLIRKFGREKKLELHEVLGRKLNIPPPPPPVRFDFDDEQQNNNAYVAPVSFSRPPTHNHQIPRSTARRLSQPRALPESVLFIRASSVPPQRLRPKMEYYDDIDQTDLLPPPPPPIRRYTRRTKRRPTYRASSEPPIILKAPPTPSPPLPVRPTYFPDLVGYVNSDPRKSHYSPSSEAAVRNAKRYLDRIERELGVANAPSVAEPVIIHRVNAVPTRVVPRSAARVAPASTATNRLRSSSLPPSPRYKSSATPRRGGQVNIEDYYDELYDDAITPYTVRPYTPLTSTRVTVRSRDTKPPLSPRMPSLDKYRPTQGGVTLASIPPYKPSQTQSKPSVNSGPPLREGFRPRVSDTRKRLREVLCATKRDPHYFD